MSLPFYDCNKKSGQVNTASGVITTITAVMIMSFTVMTDVGSDVSMRVQWRKSRPVDAVLLGPCAHQPQHSPVLLWRRPVSQGD